MKINASNFSKNRKQMSITQKRVKEILVCVINSYKKIITDGVVYDYSKIGSIKKEDYLRNRLVDDYLESELSLLENETNNYTINKETSEEYRNLSDGDLHDDPIDIHIVDYALKESWGQKTKPYFAIECKRLTSSVSSYVNDTKKATERNYSRLRLPFEGQLGFIENSSWNHKTVVENINKNLLTRSDIVTVNNLKPFQLKTTFKGSYLSKHKKKDKTGFSVFHLFLDYCKIVLN